ncbi:Ricin-type beta-trefoil lectin domain-containing protein [Nonomuraea solani]|uniref:Ricin-type beta-trefoil lectin domain-containing protein n=1 Tax=Nonomuraea solani TaxID=1144553 RepID=A0A1H5Y4Y0_9ACTN|nr:RICIN domain-containing protein [Nonomuraea solani]SEG19044.1 Ricin-type beta-trefoil lectin domain-containing protein [Nonomuraea solani]
MRTAITLLTGVVLAGGLMAVPAQAAGGSVVELKNVATGMCLAIGHGEARKGKAAIQWPCNGGREQHWLMSSDGYMANVATGMCLAIGHGEARRGKSAIQWPCKRGWEQRWKPRSAPRDRSLRADDFKAHHFMNGATQMCLAIGGGQARKGKAAIQWSCKRGASEQAWVITTVG